MTTRSCSALTVGSTRAETQEVTVDEPIQDLVGDYDFDPEAADWKPLRLVIPEHDDMGWWMWMDSTRAKDTRYRVHEYKHSFFRTYLRLERLGRVYGWSPLGGVRLIGDGGALPLLTHLSSMFEPGGDGIPHVIRLPQGEDPKRILARRELRLTDPDCPDCARENGAIPSAADSGRS